MYITKRNKNLVLSKRYHRVKRKDNHLFYSYKTAYDLCNHDVEFYINGNIMQTKTIFTRTPFDIRETKEFAIFYWSGLIEDSGLAPFVK